MLTYHRLRGAEARKYAQQLASLRLKVFWDFPYLYEGNLEYEMNYLETYFKASHSFVFLVQDQDKIVGATTGILATEEEESFLKPFESFGLDPEKIFYFGESVLLPEYRGQGIGKKFFVERETFARTLPQITILSFCAVERPGDHPIRPQGFRPLDDFWHLMGFKKEEGLVTNYEWKDRGDLESTKKKMQYWLKRL
jgi:GNAT superfamily N-acetyltransferase